MRPFLTTSIALVALFLSVTATAQNNFSNLDRLADRPLDLIITSDIEGWETLAAGIVSRGYEAGVVDGGVGYQVWKLEIISNQAVRYIRKIGKPKFKVYELTFYDEQGGIIHTVDCKVDADSHWHPSQAKAGEAHIYAIDLRDVPLILFDYAHRLEISIVDQYRF